MNLEDKLKSWSNKTITKSELENLLHTNSDEELYALISSNLLLPIKTSGTNGNRLYPIYLKYKIVNKEDYTQVLSEIAMLHPALIKNGYLQKKPELYQKYQKQILQLNRYMFKNNSTVFISKKERSFEIFEEEKQLEEASFKNLLEKIGLTKEILCYYETPEYCFNDYIPIKKSQMTLLICENKDIWFNIRRRMYEDKVFQIFDVAFDGVIYGCGNRISEEKALFEYTQFLNSEKISYFYWGDIDRAGLNIYLSLIKNNPSLNIKLFTKAYEEMLSLAKNRNIPDSLDNRGRLYDYEEIYQLFSEEKKNQLKTFIENNKRIPQEIISYEILLKAMR